MDQIPDFPESIIEQARQACLEGHGDFLRFHAILEPSVVPPRGRELTAVVHRAFTAAEVLVHALDQARRQAKEMGLTREVIIERERQRVAHLLAGHLPSRFPCVEIAREFLDPH